MQTFRQTQSYPRFQGSRCKPYLDCTRRDPIRKPRPLPQYGSQPTSNLGVTDLESSPRFWPAVLQLTLSDEAKADVYYYGLTILCLLTLVCLALCFLWSHWINWLLLLFLSLNSFKHSVSSQVGSIQGFLPDIFKVIGFKGERNIFYQNFGHILKN